MTCPCPCPSFSDCSPCNDEPIANLSSEVLDDVQVWQNPTYLKANPPLGGDGGPPSGVHQSPNPSGIGPNDIPIITPTTIVRNEVNPTLPDGTPVPLFYNEAQVVHVDCDDGGAFYVLFNAGQIVNRSVAEANAEAVSWATNWANGNKPCIDKVSLPGCLGAPMSELLTIDGGVGPFTWTALGGSLPPGTTLVLDPGDSSLANVNGLITATGSGFFTLKIFDSFGNYLIKTITWAILGNTDPTTLPDGTVGTPYSYHLNAYGGNGGPYTFTLAIGALPDGLTLDSSGWIHGTPVNDNPAYFTVTLSDGIQFCRYDFSINDHFYI